MASRDIFGFTDTAWGGTFWSRNSIFEINDKHVSLIQDYSIQYAQNIQPIYEVGSDTIYYSKSHQAGTLSIKRILSDEDILAAWGDGCEAVNCRIAVSNGVCGPSGQAGQAGGFIELKGTILQSVTWSGQAQQAYVGEDLQIQFAGLSRS
jgi:hypothetical protein